MKRSPLARRATSQCGVFAIATALLSFSGCSVSSASKVPPTSPAASPAPADLLAGKSERDICLNDAYLLARYSLKELHGSPLPPACCKPGVLPEAQSYRCKLDWPSSDVPPCRLWAQIHDAVLAAHANTTRETWPLVLRTNLTTLKQWSAEKHACQDEPEAE